MGAGKTTVGRTVAKRLDYPFFDSDHELEARCGVRIPVIFEHEGEAGFRDRETQVIAELTGRRGIVLATGGGAVLREANRAALKANGTVVYLRASPHDLWLRTRHDRNRPLLQTENPKARLEALYAERDPLYREVADFIIETGKPSVAQLANMVLMQLEMAGVVFPSGQSSAPPGMAPVKVPVMAPVKVPAVAPSVAPGADADAEANADAGPVQDSHS